MANISDPSPDPFAITPSNTVPVSRTVAALYIGTGGDVILRTGDGAADVTFKNVQSGSILPVRARFIRATGTTAQDIVGL